MVASRTAPVCEMIEHGKNGLLADFFDVDALAELACTVLQQPDEHHHLGVNAVEFIRDKYALNVCLPQLRQLFAEAADLRR